MENFEIYNDIAQRTNGDIYIGIVAQYGEIVIPFQTAKKIENFEK